MSIDTLPNELLVEIFSYLPLTMLWPISLVNQRWNQVVGLTNRIRLRFCKSIRTSKPLEPKQFEDSCIPLELLAGSSRDYKHFSYSLRSKNDRSVIDTLLPVLDYCRQKWDIKDLRIVTRYNQFILFMQHCRHLLNGVVNMDLVLKDAFREETSFGKTTTDHTQLIIPMENLKKINVQYGPCARTSPSQTWIMNFHAPKLESVRFSQTTFRTNVQLTFRDCANIRRILHLGGTPMPSSRDPDPPELESILSWATGATRLGITNGSPVVRTFSAMFGKLEMLMLLDTEVMPTDDPLECSNLTRLELCAITLRKPLKLRIPKLRALCCDSRVLQSIWLEDTFEADLLDVDLNGWDSRISDYPVGLSSFRRLQLNGWAVRVHHNATEARLWSHLTGITELMLKGRYTEDHFTELIGICRKLQRLKSVTLSEMSVPGKLNFIPETVQNVVIVDCTISGSTIEFPMNVRHVDIRGLRNDLKGCDSTEICLLPQDRFKPLVSEAVPVQQGRSSVWKAVYIAQK